MLEHYVTEHLISAHDTYRTYEADPPSHSMYQKGQSISYYQTGPPCPDESLQDPQSSREQSALL